MWTKVAQSGRSSRGRGQDCKTERRQWNLKLTPPKNSPNELQSTSILTAFTSLVAVGVICSQTFRPVKGRTHVSQQSPNSRRRKRTAQGPLGIQASHRRKYGTQFYITSLDGKVAQVYPFEGRADRAEVGGAFDLQSYEEKFLSRVNYWGQVVEMDGQGRLLMPRCCATRRRSKGEVAVTGNLTHLVVRNLEEAYRKEIEEQEFTAEDEKTLDELGI